MDVENIKTAVIAILAAGFIAYYFDIPQEIYYEITLILISFTLAFIFASTLLFSIDYFDKKVRKWKDD